MQYNDKWNTFSFAFIEKVASNDNDLVNYHIDINKYRENLLYYSQYDYPVLTVMDKPEVYDSEIHNGPGMYLIKTRMHFPT